jgi:hypothetical protein
MLMMGLQWAFSVVVVVLCGVAFRIGRHRSAVDALHPAAWTLTGIAFVPYTACMVLQNAWGTWAMVAGGRSAAMESYLLWAPAMNHSRTFVLIAFFALLAWFMLRRDPPTAPVWWGAVGVLALGAAFGVWIGWREGSMVMSTHFTRVALWDAVELVVVLAALFVALATDRVDRYLWAVLAVFGAVVAINILMYAFLALIDDPRVWSPHPWAMGTYRLALAAVMLAIALRRLALASRGVPVAGLLGRAPGSTLSVG